MNLPNKLTLFRVILIPVFVVFMLCDITPYDKWIALAVFIIASLTDFADGKIARSRGLITDFGKFMDPLADKMLVCSALICLVSMHILPAWVCIIIVARDFIISGFRLIAADNGKVIAAGWWGKFKTTFQMLMVISMIANIELQNLYILTQILMWIALVLTVVSLIDYLVKNKGVIDTANI